MTISITDRLMTALDLLSSARACASVPSRRTSTLARVRLARLEALCYAEGLILDALELDADDWRELRESDSSVCNSNTQPGTGRVLTVPCRPSRLSTVTGTDNG